MYLKRFIFVNWGNIPQLEFEFGPINLFSGGNGSGKTTAADAIQTLMTAAHDNLFNFNPGQDETTQRGRGGKQVRTLASYVLGCDDGSYARLAPTDGYLVAVFHPTQGESAEPFSAVVAMRAHLDSAGTQRQARLDEILFLILPETTLALTDFVKEYNDGKHVVPITEIANQLKMKYGARNLEVYEKKRAYLRRLYGALRGRREAVSDREAMHAAHTFSSFMAYKPVRSIHEFVADEILEKKDLGEAIQTVSDLMKTINGMEQDARRIVAAVGILSNAARTSQRYTESWVQHSEATYREALRKSRSCHRDYLDAKSRQKGGHDKLQDLAARTEIVDQRRRDVHRQMVELEAERRGVQVLREKDEFEQVLQKCQDALRERVQPMLEQDRQMVRNVEASEQMLQCLSRVGVVDDVPIFDTPEYRKQAKAVMASKAESQVDFPRLLGRDWAGLAVLESHLDAAISTELLHNHWAYLLHEPGIAGGTLSARDQLQRWVVRQDQSSQSLRTRVNQKEKELNSLRAHQAVYPPYVEMALAAIRTHCPAAEPKVLCDYVDVRDPHWQMAIEGYIGGARFSIIVEEAYEAQAIQIVRGLSGGSQRNKARVIQGEKARRDSERLSLPADSLVNVLSFEHKTAEHFLRASYGTVVRVPDANTLRSTSRGITRDGMASGNYSMFRCDMPEAELVFGRAARERALAAKEAEHLELLTDLQASERRSQEALALFNAVDAIKPVKFAHVMQEMLALHRELSRTENQLAGLNLGEHQRLEKALQELQSQFGDFDKQLQQIKQESGAVEEQLRQADRQVRATADAHEQALAAQEEAESALRRIPPVYPQFDAEAALASMENASGQDEPQAALLEQLQKQLGEQAHQLEHWVMQHNQQCAQHDALVYAPDYGQLHSEKFFADICQLAQMIDNLHNRLKNNILAERHEQLTTLKNRFNDTFVTHLCHAIYQSIGDGERILKDLNEELEHHRFGADRERFYFGWSWLPEFQEYYRFFKAVMDMPNLGDGASLFDMEMPEALKIVRDRMVSMLLDQDEQRAQRELERISDYRNYRRYEIFKEPLGKQAIPLSQYGTGSGGQLETPAYIIRAAAVTSAFRFNEGNSHLRMVLVDEAFSKMDEGRSREVIHYLTETLGLQLMFIMPTSKSGPFMDLISNQFVFSKCVADSLLGELKSRVLCDRKVCNQEKIKALWANHRQVIRHQASLDFMETFL